MRSEFEDLDGICPLPPVPKPRRILTGSISLNNLAPTPPPRTVVKMRPSPSNRDPVLPIRPDSCCILPYSPENVCFDDIFKDFNMGEDSPERNVPEVQEDTIPAAKQDGQTKAEPPVLQSGTESNFMDKININSRPPSCEPESIRIQMEDITSVPVEVKVEQAANSCTGDPEIGSSKGEDSQLEASMIRMGPEWTVPPQYSHSPIVREIAESVEQRPRPPSTTAYGAAAARESSTSVYSTTTAPLERKPTLLEQIIRTHSIWYLPHIGRPAATHMLRHMEPGNFIVRSASRSSCMAVSVRLPVGFDVETDHYIIQVGTSRGVRLENSPFAFPSLPFLLEHYCMSGEELQVRLRLPAIILACQTTKALQSIALMGQDFWSSDMSLSRSASRASQRTMESSTSFIWGVAHHGPTEGCHPIVHYAVNEAPRSLPKKRSSTGRCDPTRFATIHGDLLGAAEAKDKDTNSPPSKHERADAGHISRTERRSQSVRAPTKSANVASTSVGGSTGRRSFLKTLFGRDTSNKQPQQSQGNSPSQLAHCQFFLPYEKTSLTSARSAYDIGDLPNTNPGRDWQKGSGRITPAGNNNNNMGMKTFKPIAGYDDILASARVRPLPMRRERSDLCASSVVRLARHTEGSPEPTSSPKVRSRQPLRPPAAAFDVQSTRSCLEELRRKRLQSTNEMLHPTSSNGSESTQSATNSPQISMRQLGGWSSPWKDVNNGSVRREHRLSVPNLAAEPTNDVMQTAKALKEKLGRTTDGELGTINEGLITPVVRRKQFQQNHLQHQYEREQQQQKACYQSSLSSTSSSERSEGRSAIGGGGPVARGRETLEALFDRKPIQTRIADSSFSRKPSTDSQRAARESELVWRRTRNSDQPSTTSQSGNSSNRGSLYFPNKPNGNWSAVNSELKTRQKVAKVRPTPQQRPNPVKKMTVGGVVVPPPSCGEVKPSEYAQLADLAGSDLMKQESMTSMRDDDNVSVAGTVFNEPWDSNVWENLLDLAQHGDKGVGQRRLTDAIVEEDSDSDRTAGGSTQMAEDSDDDDWAYGMVDRRPLPSDRITSKAWESNGTPSKYSTLDSRLDSSLTGSLRRPDRTTTPPNSMMSLPRAVSRFSESNQMGSLDELPTTVPCLSPLLNGQKKSTKDCPQPGSAIQQYVERLAQDNHTIFGATLRRFIECTVESDEADPGVVVRNVRQFINGIKNYLMKHGEGELHQLIEHERNLLNANQILSIDAILEAVLHKLLLKRIKPHLYHVMVREHSRTGALEAVTANIRAVRGIALNQLGFSNPDQLVTPSQTTMEQIKLCLRKMQSHYSPIKKLENLLRALSLVLLSQRQLTGEENVDPLNKLPPADDLVRWLIFILARTSTVGCEVEAWYMWELLPQHMLTQGDASYYLTTLFSAVHVLKSMDAIKRLSEKDQTMINSIDLARQCCSSPSGSGDAFLKVAIPDVNAGCIRYATFPGVPQMTTSKLCRVIAHQQGITNPEDFGLYLVLDGFETPLQSSDAPDTIRDRMRQSGKNFLFAYKRHDAKIAWPSQVLSGLALC